MNSTNFGRIFSSSSRPRWEGGENLDIFLFRFSPPPPGGGARGRGVTPWNKGQVGRGLVNCDRGCGGVGRGRNPPTGDAGFGVCRKSSARLTPHTPSRWSGEGSSCPFYFRQDRRQRREHQKPFKTILKRLKIF